MEDPIASICGLTVDTPHKGDNVSFPLKVTGVIDNTNRQDCTWAMFEGVAGHAELFYETPATYASYNTASIVVHL